MGRAHRISPSTPLPLSQRVGDEGKKKETKKGFDFRNDKAATRVGKTGRDYGRSVTVGLFFSHGLLWCELSRLTEPVRAAAERQGHADIYRHSVACVRLLCVNPGERPFRVSHAARQLGFTISPSPNSGICWRVTDHSLFLLLGSLIHRQLQSMPP